MPRDEHEAHAAGCFRTAKAGYKILAQHGAALEAVETAVVILEDDPIFDAGAGSHLNRARIIQLDAGIMDASTLQVGTVAAIEKAIWLRPPRPEALYSNLGAALATAHCPGVDTLLITPRARYQPQATVRQ